MLSQVADQVQYNAKGNMVTLTKYLNGKPAPADAKENKAALETVEAQRNRFEKQSRIPTIANAPDEDEPLEEDVPDFEDLADPTPAGSNKPATFEMLAIKQNWTER
jgi:hypothetical protein